jgi:hypothetical protein
LISDTQAKTTETLAALQQGRDRLLELNSCNDEIADDIVTDMYEEERRQELSSSRVAASEHRDNRPRQREPFIIVSDESGGNCATSYGVTLTRSGWFVTRCASNTTLARAFQHGRKNCRPPAYCRRMPAGH